MKRALAGLGLLVGITFGYVAIHVAVRGTGASVPSGVDVLEGRVAPAEEGALVDSPVGEPFLYGEVRVTKGGSKAVDQAWTTIVGDPGIEIDTGGRLMPLRLPHPDAWRSVGQPEHREVESIEGLPHLEALDDLDRLGPPPYFIVVRAVRPGDPIIARAGEEEATDVHLGERAELEAWIAARESGRWPIVGLLGIMALVSLALGVRGIRG
jgi:hypothetical protein